MEIQFTLEQKQQIQDLLSDYSFDSFTIENVEQLENAAELLKRIKQDYKKIDEIRTSITKPIDAAKKDVMDFFKPKLMILESAEREIKSAAVVFQSEQRRIAAEAQRKAAELALIEEEKQRKKLQAQAEKAEQKGDVIKADLLKDKAQSVYVPIQHVAEPAKKIEGVATVTRWKATVINPALVPDEFKVIDEKKLQAYATAMKESASVPGVKFEAIETLSVRS